MLVELETSNKQVRGGSQFSSFSRGKTSVTNQATRTMDEVPVAMQRKSQWDPIPVNYTKLLPKLIDDGLTVPIHSTPRKLPFLKWYNVNTRCNYHAGILGHLIEDCKTFKNKVQNLIEKGKLKFEESSGPTGVEDPFREKAVVMRQEKEALRKASFGKMIIPRDDVPISKIERNEAVYLSTTKRSKK